ncbi:pyrroline-5-carboxylate reductase family protein [Aspergillus undulatus]|uniref:pyrroline-5-carboxylate reductase family protein n=1 Tax=Aspergillus undulatus TaxID=1810928 RepID=UPI003CCD33E5
MSCSTPLRLAFLGCGHIGQALLGALLPAISQPGSLVSDITVALNGQESQLKLKDQYKNSPQPVNFVYKRNRETVAHADAILLAFPPDKMHDVLGATGMREALKHKLIISVLARTPRTQLEQILQDGSASSQVRIVRAMPTIGAQVHESATLLANVGDPNALEFSSWIFNSLGRVFRVSDDAFDTATGMSAVANALTTMAVQVMARHVARGGVPVEEAVGIISQCMRGTATILLSGTAPEQLQRELSLPGSITGEAVRGLENSQLFNSLEEALSVAIKRARDYNR